MFLPRKYALQKSFLSRSFSMLVTQKNFNNFYNDLKQHLPNAEYCAFDFEMTGVRTNDPEAFSDLPVEKFHKIRSAANRYRIIQVGLCLFTRKSPNELEARPYNIFVFPRERPGFSPQIVLDASAMDFNTRHNMNWNTWVYDGITYMTMKEAEKKKEDLKKNFVERLKVDPSGEVKLAKEKDIEKALLFKTNLEAWLNSEDKNPFIVTEQTRYFRKYVYDTLRSDYPDLSCTTVPEIDKADGKSIHIFKPTDGEEKRNYLIKKQEEMEEQLLSHIGFTSVIELLIQSQKKIVGHNCFMDLMFLYSHFLETVPLDYQEFKTKLFQSFPEIYDTKFIANNTKFLNQIGFSSALNYLLVLCTSKDEKGLADVNVKLAEGFEDYDLNAPNNLRLHEAGYDAFITGLVFAKMYHALDPVEQEKVKNAVNVMKSLSYFKHGLLNKEEPMFNNHAVYFLRNREDKSKFNMADIRPHFSALEYKDLIKSTHIGEDRFVGAMVVLESENEDLKKFFEAKVFELQDAGMEVFTYKEYTDLKSKTFENSKRSSEA